MDTCTVGNLCGRKRGGKGMIRVVTREGYNVGE